MENITLNEVYNELKFLRKEIEKLEYMLIPQEKISEDEAKELKEILKEMKEGEEFRAEEVFEE
jgi:hypothetical protein